MAENTSFEACLDRHRAYPDLEKDLSSDFQYRRVKATADRVRPGETVLDVGCNSGYFVLFCPIECEVTGVDINPRLVERARQRLKDARVAEAENLPFADKTFDVVNVAEILEHVHDPEKVLREAARVARKRIIGDTPHEDGTWGERSVPFHAYHVRCFTEASLRELLEKFGRITHFDTVDIGKEPQCYHFEIEVNS